MLQYRHWLRSATFRQVMYVVHSTPSVVCGGVLKTQRSPSSRRTKRTISASINPGWEAPAGVATNAWRSSSTT